MIDRFEVSVVVLSGNDQLSVQYAQVPEVDLDIRFDDLREIFWSPPIWMTSTKAMVR